MTGEATSEVLLDARSATKRFGGFTALDAVSLDVRAGERFGMIGPNDLGKTTMINCISGTLAKSTIRRSRGPISVSRIVVDNIEAGYGSVRVLHGVSVTVDPGETVALLGTNGNGKSTLLNCIMGIVAPSSGSITFETDDGTRIELVGKTPQEVVELGISLVPEGRRLFPRLTVEENLMLGAYRDSARQRIGANLEFAFEAFPVLAERRRQLAGSMSGGEQQMLAIARALMSEPRILLVDEPSVGLAPILVSRVIAKIRELKEQRNLTVLMAEQNFNQATKIADRGYIDSLVIAGDPSSVVDQLLAFREVTGDFGTLLYACKDWEDRSLGIRSMELMAEKVMPAINAAIGCSEAVEQGSRGCRIGS